MGEAENAPSLQTFDERRSNAINRSFGKIVRKVRRDEGLTLDQLAVLSKVSRAMLSSVERGEKSPTLAILAAIAQGLNVPMSRLMGERPPSVVATVIRHDKRLMFLEEETGIERHLLSPTHLSSGVEFVEHVLPPSQIFPASPVHLHDTEKYLVVTKGTLTIEYGTAFHELNVQDAMHLAITERYQFANHGAVQCRYYVFILHRI